MADYNFKPGHAKVGGRKPGTPNKKTQALQEILEEGLGKGLPEKIVEIMHTLDPKDQVKVLLELMQYIYPKRKAIEVSGADGHPLEVYFQMNEDERKRRIEELMERKETK